MDHDPGIWKGQPPLLGRAEEDDRTRAGVQPEADVGNRGLDEANQVEDSEAIIGGASGGVDVELDRLLRLRIQPEQGAHDSLGKLGRYLLGDDDRPLLLEEVHGDGGRLRRFLILLLLALIFVVEVDKFQFVFFNVNHVFSLFFFIPSFVFMGLNGTNVMKSSGDFQYIVRSSP